MVPRLGPIAFRLRYALPVGRGFFSLAKSGWIALALRASYGITGTSTKRPLRLSTTE